jgi:hypothetical protein
MKNITTVGLRQQAVFISEKERIVEKRQMTQTTALLVANLARLGFGVSEPLLAALNHTTPKFHLELYKNLQEIVGIHKNWTPLVKGWDTPTGETVVDHIITFFANVFEAKGTQLACGHIIPANTFPLERYNGCPYCGTPFVAGTIEHKGQGSKLKVLELWTEQEAQAYLQDLLVSKTALDVTQIDSLKILLAVFPLPEVSIGMKETLMAVIDALVANKKTAEVQGYFKTPTDVMRYLWYKHTGFLQIIEPKNVVKRKVNNARHLGTLQGNTVVAKWETIAEMKLKYNRAQCLMVAQWLNHIDMDTAKMCEIMHPKRGMWVRFIRALRLPEYSKRVGFEKLRDLLDKFYKQDYEVWQGLVNHFRLRADEEMTLDLLKQRPGLFARSLFANMLWFGPEPTLAAFAEIVDKVPARLVFTLNMYAEYYFDKTQRRIVKPLGGVSKNVAPHALLALYDQKQLDAMKAAMADMCLVAMQKRFAAIATESQTMYIAPALYYMPVAIGDRSETIEDLPSALMGTRFPVEGNSVRLFMQWGTGLPAQHMDMDLSCHIAFEQRYEFCAYHNLVATGCKHSGDIRSIPHQIGTAEYIEIDVPALRMAGAKYVTFTCNAYSNGSITPNLVVGWMNSAHRMKISETTGVAYDPSCVQHQVRVVNGLSKGLVFGVLDVAAAEIVWMEIPFAGQVAQNLDVRNVQAMLAKLESKLTIGNLLALKAQAQGITLVETPEADEVYTAEWARNAAAVTQLLVD